MAASGGLATFMREQLGKPIPAPAVLGQVTGKFRDAVKAMAERRQIPVYQRKVAKGHGGSAGADFGTVQRACR